MNFDGGNEVYEVLNWVPTWHLILGIEILHLLRKLLLIPSFEPTWNLCWGYSNHIWLSCNIKCQSSIAFYHWAYETFKQRLSSSGDWLSHLPLLNTFLHVIVTVHHVINSQLKWFTEYAWELWGKSQVFVSNKVQNMPHQEDSKGGNSRKFGIPSRTSLLTLRICLLT